MAKIPKRIEIAKLYRKFLKPLERFLIFPVKDPNFYQVLSLSISVLFLFIENLYTRAVLVALVMFLDWLDGAVARRYKLANRKGWLTDVVVDRVSEGFIFASILFSIPGKIFFTLYLINITLSMCSIKSEKHLILPLRFLYFIYLIGIILLSIIF